MNESPNVLRETLNSQKLEMEGVAFNMRKFSFNI